MRIFVGGLPRTATKEDVVRLFRQFGAGEDDVVLPRDRRTRRRKGFAYVEIADIDRARAAIAIFTGFEVEGKPLTVCAAEDRPLKRPRRKLAIVLALMAAGLAATARVNADPAGTDAAITLNPVINAVHESFNDRVQVPPVPIPLLDLRHRSGPFELELSGLPPVAAVGANDAIQGRTSTRLSQFDGTFRVWDPLRRFSIGLGQTLYNQSTHYAVSREVAGTGETQFSRVTGAHYEVGYRVPYLRGRFEATVSYAPVLLGTQFSQYDNPLAAPRRDPERAEQIDTALHYVHQISPRSEILMGLRYLNFTSRYAEINGGLADRNAGLLAVFGYRTRIGR